MPTMGNIRASVVSDNEGVVGKVKKFIGKWKAGREKRKKRQKDMLENPGKYRPSEEKWNEMNEYNQ